MRGAKANRLLSMKVEGRARHAPFRFTTAGDDVVHAGELVCRAKAGTLISLIPVGGLSLAVRVFASTIFFCGGAGEGCIRIFFATTIQ